MNLREWHNAVIKRDNYICQYCGKDFSYPVYFDEKGTNQYVCGDHVQTQGAHPESRLDIANGKTTCFPCHDLRHRGKLNS